VEMLGFVMCVGTMYCRSGKFANVGSDCSIHFGRRLMETDGADGPCLQYALIAAFSAMDRNFYQRDIVL
jgi:hypothetical protein